jgi:hypothetical protein
MYTFEQLKEDVRKEAEALRVHATKDERERLNMQDFNGNLQDGCIYGLMTGSCASERAHELIRACCSKYIINDGYSPSIMRDRKDIEIPVAKTSSPKLARVRKVGEMGTTLKYLSAVEAYVMVPNSKDANLISYLRGETETLTL